MEEEEFDFSDVIETEPKDEFDFSDVVEEFDFSDVEDKPQKEYGVWDGIKAAASPSGIRPMLELGEGLVKSAYSGLTDQIPQTLAQTAEVFESSINPTNLEEFIKTEKPVDFQNYVRSKDPKFKGISGIFTSFGDEGFKEFIPKYGKQFIEDQGLGRFTEEMDKNLPKVIQRRKVLEEYVQGQKKEAEEKTAGTIKDYRQINNVDDLGSYIGSLVGQTAYQIPLSVATKGASSYVMEAASVYDKQLDRIAKENKISREEVIEKNLDSPAVGQGYAALAASLDKVSAGNIMSALRKSGGSLLKKWIATAGPEAITEPIQGILEDVGAGGTVQDAVTGEGLAARVNEFAGGLVGGSVFSFVGKGSEKKIADQMINESDTGNAGINGLIDAEATLTPEEESTLKTKVAETRLEEAQEAEKALIKEEAKAVKEEVTQVAKDSGNKTPNAENSEANTAETAENRKDTADIKDTTEYQEALSAIETLQQKITTLPLDQNADELIFDLRNARQKAATLAAKAGVTTSKGAKTDTQRQIEDTTGVTKPEKSVKMTPGEAIKQQVQTFYKGMDKGVKKGAEAKNELVSKVQEAIKSFPLETRQVNSILSRVKRTNLFTPGSISRLNTYIDRVTQDAEYADKISEAQSINKKIRKLSKQSTGNLQKYTGVGKSFASINPEDTFINKHLELGRKILSGLTTPEKPGYSAFNVAEAEEYITGIQDSIIEEDSAETEASPEGDKRNVQLFSTLNSSLEALNEKDFSEFDDSEKQVIETLKSLNPSDLTNDQAKKIVRVIDNIVENDDFSNAVSAKTVIKAIEGLKTIGNKYEKVKKDILTKVGDTTASTYQQFSQIFGDSGIAADVQQQLGIMGMINGGSRVENQENAAAKEYADKIKALNKKYNTSIQEIDNQTRLFALAELAKNYGDDSHIEKVKNNIQRSINEYQKSDPQVAESWTKALYAVKNINTSEEAVAKLKETPALYEIWEFNKNKFAKDINPRLKKNRIELFNKAYVEANNYSHTGFVKLSDNAKKIGEAEKSPSKKVKGKEATTSMTATRSMTQGSAYAYDWISTQLRGYRESLYAIEVAPSAALVNETIYTPEFEKIVGGYENAKVVKGMLERAEEIQKGLSGNANEAIRFINSATQFVRNIGSVRALGSAMQPLKQVPSVWTKAFFNHIGTGSLPSFFQGLKAVSLSNANNDNLVKLFNQYTVGVRGQRLGGIERGDSVGYKLSPGSSKSAAKLADNLRSKSEQFSKVVLTPLTMSDVYAARTTWMGYYLQSLAEQGVKSVDVNNEYLLQEDQKRKTAAAYAEQMIAETQVPSNPATLSQLTRNENDGGWNFAKNLLLPFSTYSLNAKYRNISDVSKFLRNPNAKNASAVAGDMAEILAFASVSYLLLPYYKDWLKGGIESLFGLESDDEDEEAKAKKKEKAFYTNVVNSALPLSIGTVGEYGTSKFVNSLAYLAANPDASYQDWKKETGGFVYEPESAFDAGVFGLGFQPYVETATGVIDLTKAINGDAITYDNFGRTEEATLTPEQTNLLALKVLLEMGGTVGLGEADVYNQVKKVFKEQLKGSNQPTSTPSVKPRPRPRPRMRPRPRPRNLK
jgi:hypothetical protein